MPICPRGHFSRFDPKVPHFSRKDPRVSPLLRRPRTGNGARMGARARPLGGPLDIKPYTHPGVLGVRGRPDFSRFDFARGGPL